MSAANLIDFQKNEVNKTSIDHLRMGRVYRLNKAEYKGSTPPCLQDIEIWIGRTVSDSDYRQLAPLMAESEMEIKDSMSSFVPASLLADSDNKVDMHFAVALARHFDEIIGYGIAYCPLDNLEEYYLDVVFVKKPYRNRKISYHLLTHLISGILNVDRIVRLKANTQDDNHEALKLLNRLGFPTSPR